jgi:hypothetical protein
LTTPEKDVHNGRHTTSSGLLEEVGLLVCLLFLVIFAVAHFVLQLRACGMKRTAVTRKETGATRLATRTQLTLEAVKALVSPSFL